MLDGVEELAEEGLEDGGVRKGGWGKERAGLKGNWGGSPKPAKGE